MPFRIRKHSKPPCWDAYCQAFRHTYRGSTPIREVRFVVFDTEATGLNPRRDQVISLGAVGVQAARISLSDTYEFTLPYSSGTGREAIPVHGVLPGAGRSASLESAALNGWLDFIRDGVLVGHHVGFDRALLNRTLRRHFGIKMRNTFLDTAELARKADRAARTSRPSYSLDALCTAYHIVPYERHTAGGDALLTAILFLKLLHRLEANGSHTLADLFRPSPRYYGY